MLLACIICSPVIGAGAEVRIHVAPDGNDAWTGRSETANAAATDGPVATLARAQSLARVVNAAARGVDGGPVRVMVKAGTYVLTSPLVFGPADSGSQAAPVRYEAVQPGTVLLTGGVRLTRRAAARSGEPAVFDLPAGAAGSWRGGGQLFVNGERATLARMPKAGSAWFVQHSVPLESEPPGSRGHEAFMPSAEAATWLAELSGAQRARAVVQLMHSWNTSQHRLVEPVSKAGRVRVTPRARWAFLSTGTSQRWYVENVPSALTEPGEWIGTESEVRYLPTPTQARAQIQAVMPLLEQLVVVRGEPAKNQWVEHLSFHGLTFAHTRNLTPDAGFVDSQAVIGIGAAVEVDGARHLVWDQCDFNATAGYALWLRQSVTDSRVTRSTFRDLGAGAIQVGVARAPAADTPATERITIQANTISQTGRLLPGAVGIWVGQAFATEIVENTIHDTSYSGISVGWTWGFGPSASGRHTIRNNLLFDIGGGQLSDEGGIYTLGTLTGTTITGNVIREVRAYPGYGPGPNGGGWGIYNDEGTRGVLVEGNVVVETDSGGYHLNKGREIMVRGNLFAAGKQAEVRLTQADTERPQARLEKNILIPRVVRPFDALAREPELAFSGNQVSGQLVSAPMDLAGCAAGCSSSQARITMGTAPRDLRFEGLDGDTAKRFKETVAAAGAPPAGLQVAASNALRGGSKPQPLAPALTLVIDMGSPVLGQQPAGLQYSPALGRGIEVVTNSDAPSGRCLQFNDSDQFARQFDPHAFVRLNHDGGTTAVSFWLLIDSDSDFLHEWRDNSEPFLTGPSLRVDQTGVFVNGKRVATSTVGEWMQVRISSTLARAPTTWALELRTSAGTFRSGPLPPASKQWQHLNYAGFISNAKKASKLCLADLKIENSTNPK